MSRLFKQTTQGPKAGNANPVRLALVDGDPASHASFRFHLAAHEPDWQLDLHTHGKMAWPALRAAPPQLMLLERTLPDGCGLEWLRRCKEQFPDLPVIILTSQGCARTLSSEFDRQYPHVLKLRTKPQPH